MSLAATQWALTVPPGYVAAGPWRLLVHLSDYADPKGRRVFPGKERLARELRCSERTVERYLVALQKAGLIFTVDEDQKYVENIRADRRPTVYRLNLKWQPDDMEDAFDDEEDSDERGDSSVAPSDPVDNSDGATTAVVHGATTAVATKDSIEEPSVNHQRARDTSASRRREAARRALAELPAVQAHPGSLGMLLLLAYEVGDEDPWYGYTLIRDSLDRGAPPEDTRNLYRLLRYRLITAQASA